MSEKNVKDSNDDSSCKGKKHEEKKSGSSTLGKTKHRFMNKTASGSEDICPLSTEEKDEDQKNEAVTFIILRKKHEVNALK